MRLVVTSFVQGLIALPECACTRQHLKMKRLLIIALLFGTICTASISDLSNEEVLVTPPREDYDKEKWKLLNPQGHKIYASDYEIVRIVRPLNALNKTPDKPNYSEEEIIIFFVEAEIKNGVREYKGVHTLINYKATEVLATGTDIAASNDESTSLYIAATDGLYVYKNSTRRAEKLGPITDHLISIAKVNGTDEIYILNNRNEVFKVTQDGNKKTKVDSVVGAKQISVDYSNNLYFYREDKKPYVLTAGRVHKIEGLPENPKRVDLINPMYIFEDGVLIFSDSELYWLFVNRIMQIAKIRPLPTAISVEATTVHYYGIECSIYMYDVTPYIIEDTVKKFVDTMFSL